MIYDNAYACMEARRLVSQYQGDELVREISGQLIRFYSLGKYAVITPITKELREAEKRYPK